MMLDEGGCAATPVPVSATATLPLAGSLLAMVSVPDCAPALVGLNVKVATAIPPAATLSVVGETANGAAVLRLVTFSAAAPLLDMVTVAVWLCPTVTLPKLTPTGLTDICGVAAATP